MAGSKKKNDFFWVSFSDLMTTMFFVMLVLFVLTVVYLKIEQAKTEAELGDLKRIVQLKEQFKPLEDDGQFHYLPICKKFVAKELMGQEIFEPEKTEILPDFIKPTVEIGKKLESFLNDLQQQNPDFSYLLVIEGNMANTWNQRYDKNSPNAYKKSYERALAVYNLWLKNNINFRKKNVEVLISGSGFHGLCREPVEENNKRFSIQIIPKVSNNI
jgi:hypothetical protein